MNLNQQLLTLLNELQTELKAHSLWSQSVPTEQQLDSQVPFAADVMPFEQWLQFIFIPRLSHLVKYNLPLPQSMGVAPMAEISFGHQFSELNQILKRIDVAFEEKNG